LEKKLVPLQSFLELSPKIVTGALGLLEERSELNRLLASQVLGRVGEACEKNMSPELVHKVYPGKF
jgi:hypothetical protein